MTGDTQDSGRRALYRATLRPEVIREWKRRRHALQRSDTVAWVLLVLTTIGLLMPMALKIIEPFPWAAAVAMAAISVGFYLRVRHQFVLSCPNCGKHPGIQWGQIVLYRVECCPHCLHWLEPPGGAPK